VDPWGGLFLKSGFTGFQISPAGRIKSCRSGLLPARKRQKFHEKEIWNIRKGIVGLLALMLPKGEEKHVSTIQVKE
jgi:hypothetical protein